MNWSNVSEIIWSTFTNEFIKSRDFMDLICWSAWRTLRVKIKIY